MIRSSAATVGYLLPVVSVVLGTIVLDEELTFRVVAGMVVVLAGVGLTRWQRRDRDVRVVAMSADRG